jgi:hypothetical protein
MDSPKWTQIPAQEHIQKTIESLKANGMEAVLASSKDDAKAKALALIPTGAEVMTMTSVTLSELGITKELDETGKYNSVRAKFKTMDKATQGLEMQRLGAAPEYTIGSAHAVTEDGTVFIASNTGSQLAAYVYGASHVVWVVGVQKIVANDLEAKERLYEHTLPLESERAHKAYGVPGSFVSKLLMVNREVNPGRIHIIFVPEVIGF